MNAIFIRLSDIHSDYMQIIISPAKTMVESSSIVMNNATVPRFQKNATEIAWLMANYSVEELKKTLKLSPKLAIESYQRFHDFHSTESEGLQALLAYTGVVFKHIHPEDFTPEEFIFSENHLRIVSICYGLLKASDKIKPYRMEYDIKLPELSAGNMYQYWQNIQTETLINDIKNDDGILFNLASLDVQPSFLWKNVEKEVRIITPEFKVLKDGKAKTVVIYAKMARGEMCRHIIKNKITNPEELKAFQWEGFIYREDLSTENNWVFLQDSF